MSTRSRWTWMLSSSVVKKPAAARRSAGGARAPSPTPPPMPIDATPTSPTPERLARRASTLAPLRCAAIRALASAAAALHATGIDRLLRIAAARGASTLYLTSQARPSIRVDGEISPIDGESALERSRRRGADSRHHPRAQPRSAAQPGGHRVDLRRARRRAASAASRSAIIAAPAASSA